MNKLTNKFTCSSQPSGLPAFMPCTTVVAYRVLQVFHYHTIYISLVDVVIIRDHQLIIQPLYSLNPPNRRPIPTRFLFGFQDFWDFNLGFLRKCTRFLMVSDPSADSNNLSTCGKNEMFNYRIAQNFDGGKV